MRDYKARKSAAICVASGCKRRAAAGGIRCRTCERKYVVYLHNWYELNRDKRSAYMREWRKKKLQTKQPQPENQSATH